MHSAVSLLASALVFPSSISALFTSRLQGVFGPLATSLELHRTLLRTPTDSPDFSPKAIIAAVNQAEGSLVSLAAAARLLKADFIYGRFAPSDFHEIHNLVRRLVVRSNGMTIFFTLIDPTREKFPVTPAPSRPQTPADTPLTSRPPSPDLEFDTRADRDLQLETPTTTIEEPSKPVATTRRRRSHLHYLDSRSRSRAHNHNTGHHKHSHSHHSHHNLLHNSLIHLAMSHEPKGEDVVGVFESNRYIHLESSHLTHPDSARLSAQTTRILDESADELLGSCVESLKSVNEWMGQTRRGRWEFWINGKERKKIWKEKLQKYEGMKQTLEDALERFRTDKR